MALHTTVAAPEVSLFDVWRRKMIIDTGLICVFLSYNAIPEWALQRSVVSLYILFMPYKKREFG